MLINVGSQELSTEFGTGNLVSLYLSSMIICSSLARVLNSSFLIKTSYKLRILCLSLYLVVGYVSLFFILNMGKNEYAFFLSLIPAFIMGTGSAFGESIILGYLKKFPEDIVSGWSSGTGLSGVMGAGLSLLFTYLKIQPKLLYLAISPICILYFICFIFIERLFRKFSTEVGYTKDADNQENENNYLTCQSFIPAFKKGKRFILNLFLVYFLEYTILSGFCERASKKGYVEHISDKYVRI